MFINDLRRLTILTENLRYLKTPCQVMGHTKLFKLTTAFLVVYRIQNTQIRDILTLVHPELLTFHTLKKDGKFSRYIQHYICIHFLRDAFSLYTKFCAVAREGIQSQNDIYSWDICHYWGAGCCGME